MFLWSLLERIGKNFVLCVPQMTEVSTIASDASRQYSKKKKGSKLFSIFFLILKFYFCNLNKIKSQLLTY